jgi:hypothetical protein
MHRKQSRREVVVISSPAYWGSIAQACARPKYLSINRNMALSTEMERLYYNNDLKIKDIHIERKGTRRRACCTTGA